MDWCDGRIAPGRTADVFCEQVRVAVTRSKRRGRVAIVIADHLKTHASGVLARAQHARRIEGAPLSGLYACV